MQGHKNIDKCSDNLILCLTMEIVDHKVNTIFILDTEGVGKNDLIINLALDAITS